MEFFSFNNVYFEALMVALAAVMGFFGIIYNYYEFPEREWKDRKAHLIELTEIK